MFDRLFSLGAMLVAGGMLATALRPGAPTANVILAATHGFAWDLAASEGKFTP